LIDHPEVEVRVWGDQTEGVDSKVAEDTRVLLRKDTVGEEWEATLNGECGILLIILHAEGGVLMIVASDEVQSDRGVFRRVRLSSSGVEA